MIKKIRRELIEKKLADTKKFLDFLSDFKENPNNYRRIVVETIFTGLDNVVLSEMKRNAIIIATLLKNTAILFGLILLR